MDLDLSEFVALFVEEAREHLSALEGELLSIDIAAPGAEALNAVFRAAHSIKGGAATFGLNDVIGLAHVMESLLDQMRRGERPLNQQAVDVLLQAADVLRDQIDATQGGAAVDPDRVAAMHALLTALQAGDGMADAAPAAAAPAQAGAAEAQATLDAQAADANATPQAASPAPVAPTTDATTSATATTDTPAAAEVAPPLTAAPAEAPAPAGAAPAPAIQAAAPPLPLPGEGSDFGFFDPQPPAAPPVASAPAEPVPSAPAAAGMAAAPAAAPAPATVPAAAAPKPAAHAAAAAAAAGADGGTIRVNVGKVDQILNLVGELVIIQSMLAQLVPTETPGAERLRAGLDLLERNTRDLQEAAMSVRMRPISAAFDRFPRLVRDLARQLDKQVALQVSGESTELDRNLIEQLMDPLTHLLRNSLDHGLEPAEQRLAAGKHATGTIRLDARHESGQVVIEVSDDGRGLNRERILAKARERGIPLPEQPDDAQVWALICQPGFSTAEQVTDLSGRGVGMDIVNSNIRALGGRLEIHSETGRGTRMTVRLPLTLAILDGLMVRCGDETFILPLTVVVESLRPAPKALKTVAGSGRMLYFRGSYVPVLPVGQAVGFAQDARDEQEGILVVLDADGKRVALLVDSLIGQQQVVIKSLESNFRKVDGLSGATILGNGRVAFILDAVALGRMALTATAMPSFAAAPDAGWQTASAPESSLAEMLP